MSETSPSLLDRLTAGTIDPQRFDHVAHLVVAHEALSRHSFFEATRRIAEGLEALTARIGVPEKYNATLTFAYMSLVAERMAADPTADAAAFVAANPDLTRGAPFARWYSEARMSSPLARRVALLPDLG